MTMTYQRRTKDQLADAEVDDGAVEDVLRDALRELVLGSLLVGHVRPPS